MNVWDTVADEIIQEITGETTEQLAGQINAVSGVLEEFSNVKNNFGPFTVFLIIALMGFFMLAMSWGEDLVDTIGDQLSRLTTGAPAASGATAAKTAPVAEEALAL